MRLARELRRRGDDAVVFTHPPVEPNPEDPTVPVRATGGRHPLSIAAGLAGEIARGGFSHVIIQYTAQMWGANRFGSPALPLLAAYLASRGLQVVVVLHELATPWQARPDLALGAALMRIQLGGMLRAARWAFVTTDTRLEMAQRVARVAGSTAPLTVLRVSPNALPVSAVSASGRCRIGTFSTLAVGKSFEAVIGAFEQVANVHPEADLVLVGDLGPKETRRRRALEARIASSASAKRIHVTGKLPLREIAETVASFDLYLFSMETGANTRSGTLPLALGAGVPVIAVRGRETDALFQHGRNVYFADTLDADAFARAALELLANPRLSTQVAEGGRELYTRELSWQRTVDVFLEALGGVVSPI